MTDTFRKRFFCAVSKVTTVAIAIAFVGAPLVGATAAANKQAVQITGAGATFPYAIYSAWFAAYANLRPDVQINYLSVGSGAGIQQVSEQIVFFGATDTPMNEDEFQAAPSRIIHLPTVVGAVAAVYNLPGVPTGVKFDGQVLADIFLGRIRNWNDPALVKLNPGIVLPPTDLTVVYRSDSSGTSFILGDFLSKVSPDWRRQYGPNRAPKLLVGLEAKGSEGISGLVKQTPGSIGYVELIYAIRNQLDMGAVLNSSGEFVMPSIAGAAASAAAAVPQMPRDFRVSITNAPGSGVYPISSFTWMLVYQNHHDKERSRLLVDFLRWAVTDGQALAPPLGFAPLPAEIVKLEIAALATVKTS